jgi:hypothetical protein
MTGKLPPRVQAAKLRGASLPQILVGLAHALLYYLSMI